MPATAHMWMCNCPFLSQRPYIGAGILDNAQTHVFGILFIYPFRDIKLWDFVKIRLPEYLLEQ